MFITKYGIAITKGRIFILENPYMLSLYSKFVDALYSFIKFITKIKAKPKIKIDGCINTAKLHKVGKYDLSVDATICSFKVKYIKVKKLSKTKEDENEVNKSK